MNASLIPPQAALVDAWLSWSMFQVDRLCLKVMNRMFVSTWDEETDEMLAQRLAEAQEFYGHPEYDKDPAKFHLPPGPHAPQVRRLGRLPGGTLNEVTFDSGFVPVFPGYREPYLEFEENRKIHLWHLRHDRPCPTLLYVHGWAGGYTGFEMRYIPLRAVYDRGYDVALFTLPFHGVRTPRQAWFGGQLFPCPRIDRTNEGFAHAIHDLRVVLEHIRGQDRGPIGLMGLSLGGYVSSLLTGLGDQVEFLILMIPLADLPELFWSQGEDHPDRVRAERMGITREVLQSLYAVHSPLRHRPRLPRERVLIVAGRGDGICTRAQTEMLWRHFNEPAVHWFPGGHIGHIGRGVVGKTLGDFVEAGFSRTTTMESVAAG